MLKVVLSFESVDEILKCDHSNESYLAVLSCRAVYYATKGNCTLFNLWMKSWIVTIQMVLSIMLLSVVLTFESVDEILKCAL